NNSNTSTQTIYSIQSQLLTPSSGGRTPNGTGGTTTVTPVTTPTTATTPNGTSTPTPGGTTPTSTSTPTSTPTPTNLGSTLPPGSPLPSESACASSIAYSSFEPRTDNYTANHSVPTAAQIANLQPWGPLIGLDGKSDSLRKQITGNFTGTTDEILQWVACKWGIDVNIVRAQAVQESNWHQSQLGDYTTNQSLCPPGKWNGSSCYQSYGILQIKYTYFKTEWPMSEQDTAFNAEFVYGWIRNCFEGWTDYLYSLTPAPGYPNYHAGDIWGCLGFWFSGGWYTQGAINYIKIIQQDYNQKPWLQPGF
ncbi:MAG TPA: hypothetical protein VGT44_22355, partial [Ktedonobacteraceae bacterium]|nr:hypothetical protein [Ktedonobacteraceae bacterium]